MKNPLLKAFAEKAVQILSTDENVLGLAAGGSWITGETDEFSDIDLVLVTRDRIAPELAAMRSMAGRLGTVLSSFTGDHVGEPRLLIVLYDDPLLHVDIKFVTLAELAQRVENPVILFERDEVLTRVLNTTDYRFPQPDFTWLEDRYWVWVHYGVGKIGRGEFLEALDFLSFLRGMVLGPLLHLKHGSLPRGVRKLEMILPADDLARLHATVARPERASLLDATRAAAALYDDLSGLLYPATVTRRSAAREAAIRYLETISHPESQRAG
ncbi:nucleotidyltransferase domain-containing protein [Tellurirhabdus rosea]|uniref:nucleotidyltransferase domain-containing protein n=1 Tax=Tellurirhabdus rosea TaxID=2674997 RepID=UPI0022524434|nr:nucleotidyltransferase domain-containing protein [Tellurirhabdus rosea]